MRRILLAANLIAGLTVSAACQAQTGTLDKVKADGKITLGHREASVPFSYLDDAQRPVGYSLDICLELVAAIRARLKLDRLDVALAPVTSATRIPLLANGTIDLECGSTTNTRERQAIVAFSPTTYVATSNFVSKKADNLADFSDLKGKRVTSTSGTTSLVLINELSTQKGYGYTILPARDHSEAFLMVETGRAAAFVMDDILLAGLVANSKSPDAYAISKEFLSLEPYAIMLRKDDPAFKALVDEAMASLLKSPRFAALYRKWFETAIPPRGVNLSLPMSEALKKAAAKPTDSADPATYR